MPFKKIETTESVIVTTPAPKAAVIWLHGLGADGHDFVPIVPELGLKDTFEVRFVFPHARMRPVTINNGYVMRAWYDIKFTALSGEEDEIGIRESEARVRGLIERERESGIAVERILLAGFSQGGAIALHTALRYPQKLAGVLALSTYLPIRGTVRQEMAAANRNLPISMAHGTQDSMVPLALGERSRDALAQMGFTVTWKQYPMAHEVNPQEIA